MARHLVRSLAPVGVLFTALAAVCACSAPPGAEGDEDSVPEFSGTLPGLNGAAPPANPGTNPGAPGGVGTPNNEQIGSNPGSVPVNDTGSGSNGSGQASSGAGGSAAVPPTGAAGSAMTGDQPVPGAGGSGMPVGAGGSANAGVAGAGSVPPGNNQPDPGTPVTPPPLGAGCGAGALFCEDFEGLPLGALTGTVNGMRVERTVDVFDEPGRGRVLRVQAGTGYGNKSGVFLDNFAPPNNSFFGRAFIRVAQFPTAGGDHWVLVEATANDVTEQARPVGGQFARWAPGSDGPSAQDWTDWEQSEVAAAAGVYECVEWQLNGANGGNDMLLWVNGEEIRPLDRGNYALPTVQRLWLGFVVYQNGQPPMHDVRFDDVVLSSERIGCD